MKNQREEQILLSLKRFDYMTRKQLQVMHDLKSERNAQRVLKQMERYLNVIREDKNIYYLNKKGRDCVDCNKIRKKTQNIDHYLMRNDLYIHYNYPQSWRNEVKITSNQDSKKIIIVTDAHFIHNKQHHLVEIDNTQTMKKNRQKIEKYRRLIERNVFKGMPKLIWVTKSHYRQSKLTELCEGLDVKVFLNTDFK